MPNHDRKPFTHLLPAILSGAAALIAALTTVYVNVRNDRHDAVAPPPAQAAAPATPQAPRAPARVILRLQRIAVQHDGSVGSTDWRFAVEADGEPLFVFTQDGLDDSGGRNVAVPGNASGELRLQPGKPIAITIQGWRGSRLRLLPGAADVHGQGTVADTGALAPITVAAAEPGDGRFVFYFAADAE